MTDTKPTLNEEQSVSDQPEVLRQVLLTRRRIHVEALERIDAEIDAIRTELNQRIDNARIQRKPIEDALGHLDALIRIEGWTDFKGDDVHHTQALGGNGKTPIEAAYDLLSTLGKPLHYRELALQLSDRGVYLAGKDTAATLLSKMSRDDRFRRAPQRGTYGLASWQMPKNSVRKRKAKGDMSSRSRRGAASQA